MENRKEDMPFGQINYKLMLFFLALIILGFVIMALDTVPFGFGFMGLVLGPIVVVSGFLGQIYAILKKK
jgi:hypothetical protein